jgi:glutathione S-transferase
VSPLAQAQANQDISSVARFIEMVGGGFGPEMLQLLIDGEQTAIYLARKFGVPESLIRDEEQRRQIAALAQQLAQQQQGMAIEQQG